MQGCALHGCALGSGWEHGGAPRGQMAVGPQGLLCHCRCGYCGPSSTVQVLSRLQTECSAPRCPWAPLWLSAVAFGQNFSAAAPGPGHKAQGAAEERSVLHPIPTPLPPGAARAIPAQSLAGHQLVSGIHQTRGSSRTSRALSIAPSPRDVGQDVGRRVQTALGTHSAPCGVSTAPGSRPRAVREPLCLSFLTRGGGRCVPHCEGCAERWLHAMCSHYCVL